MSGIYNYKINLLKALAILLVVSGHLEFSLIPMFPPYSFQIVLFFFISGMLFNEKYGFYEYIKRRFKTLMIPYYIYAFAYLGITAFMASVTGKFWGMRPTLFNEIIMPFLTGHQLDLISPLWFVPCLFITLIIYKAFSYIKIPFKLGIYLILALLAVQMQQYAENIYILWLFRTMFALFFVHIGHLYQVNALMIEKKYNIFSSKILYFVLIFQSFLWLTNKDFTPQDGIGLHFLLVWGSYNNQIVPVLTSLTGIWICLFIVKHCHEHIKDWSFLEKTVNNTYHIAANHLFVFNIITYTILSFKGISFDIKNNADIYWFYFPQKTTYFYFFAGIILTTYFGEFLKFIKKLYKNCKN